MAVKLVKGQKIDLKKDAPNLRRILVGLGWDPIKSFGSMDIDASVICIDENGSEESTVYFGHLRHSSGAIVHHGDNLTGDGDGDDEQIEIMLDDVPAKIHRLSIIINIFNADSKGQDFSMVENCFVHVTDRDTGKELIRYEIDGNFDGQKGIFVGDIYRYNGTWKFNAIGGGVKASSIRAMVSEKCH